MRRRFVLTAITLYACYTATSAQPSSALTVQQAAQINSYASELRMSIELCQMAVRNALLGLEVARVSSNPSHGITQDQAHDRVEACAGDAKSQLARHWRDFIETMPGSLPVACRANLRSLQIDATALLEGAYRSVAESFFSLASRFNRDSAAVLSKARRVRLECETPP